MGLTDNLLAYYRCEEASWNGTAGEVKDSSGNSYDGTATSATTTASGKVGRGGNFDGTGYVTIPNGYTNLLSGKDNFAIAFWVNFNSLSTNPTLWSRTATNKVYGLITVAGAVRLSMDDATWIQTADGVITTGSDFLIIVEKTGVTTGKITVNNIEKTVTGSLVATPVGASEDLYIGQYYGDANRLNGVADEIAFWDRTLTTDEKTELYNGGAGINILAKDINLTVKKASFNVEGLSGGNNLDVTTPPAVLAIEGLAANAVVGSLDVTVHKAVVALGGTAGETASFDLVVAPSALAFTDEVGDFGTFNCETPPAILSLHGGNSFGAFAIEAEPALLSLSSQATTGHFALVSPTALLALAGNVGHSGAFDFATPPAILTLQGASIVNGVLNLPVAAAKLLLQSLGTAKCLVVSTDTWLPCEYDAFDFDSIIEFQGRVLLFDASGIYELAGDTDNGSPIAATFTVGLDDAQTAKLKSIPEIYVGMKSAGQMQGRVIADDVSGDPFTLLSTVDEATQVARLMTRRAEGPRGLFGRYVGLQLENVAGCDFEVDSEEMRAEVSPRKV